MSQNQKLRKIATGQTKGMINAYICEDLHIIITKNMDNGYAPAQVGCPTCDKVCNSLGFNVNQNLSHAVEFFKPTEAQIQAASLTMTKKEHATHMDYLNRGGLISREAKLPKLDDGL